MFTPDDTASYDPATSNTEIVTVGKSTPTVTLTTDKTTVEYDGSLTLDASITPNNAAGNVQFKLDGNNLGDPVAVSAGKADKYSTVNSQMGFNAGNTYNLTAEFTPDDPTSYNSATSNTKTLAVTKATPAQLNLTTDKITANYGEAVTLETKVADGGDSGIAGSVQFKNNGANLGAPVTLDPNVSNNVTLTVSDLPLGVNNIEADFTSQDPNYNSGTTNQVSVTVTKETPTVTLTVDDVNPDYGQNVTLDADLGQQVAGTIQFKNSGTNLGPALALSAGKADLTVNDLPLGANNLTAVFTPDDTSKYNDATSNTVVVTVDKATPDVLLTSDKQTSSYGEEVSLLATVTPELSGSVEFSNNGNPLGSPVVVTAGQAASLAVTDLPVGSNDLTAEFTPDDTTNYNNATSAAVTVEVSKATPAVTLLSDKSLADFGEEVTLDAVVDPVLAGSVQFQNNGNPLGDPVTVSGAGQAQLKVSNLPVGENDITAVFTPDDTTNYNNATSNKVIVSVGVTATTTTLTANPTSATYGDTVNLTADVLPNNVPGTVEFMSGNVSLGTDTVESGTAAISTDTLQAGSNNLTAIFTPDDTLSYAVSTSPVVVVDIAKVTTTVVVTSDKSASSYGENLTLTANVAPLGVQGNVEFMNNGNNLGNPVAVAAGSAQLSLNNLPVGDNLITATFTPDDTTNYDVAGSLGVKVTVSKADTTTTLSSDKQSIEYGETVTFTADVAPNDLTGEVEFFNNTAFIGRDAVLNGQASVSTDSLPIGTQKVTAVFTPTDDTDYNVSTSNEVDVLVGVTQTVTTLTASPTNPTYGESVSLTADVSPNDVAGEVEFMDNGASLGKVAVSSGQAALATDTLTTGGHELTAEFTPDDTQTYGGSTSLAITVTVDKATPKVTLTTDKTTTTYGEPVTATANVTPDLAGSVQFQNNGTSLGDPVVVVAGSASVVVDNLPVGANDLTAVFTPDDTTNYNDATSNTETVNVGKATPKVTLSSDKQTIVVGQEVTFNVNIAPDNIAGNVQFKDNGNNLGNPVVVAAGKASLTTDILALGDHSITAEFTPDDTAKYNDATSNTLNVKVANLTPTQVGLQVTPDKDVTYGDALTLEANTSPAGVAGEVEFSDAATSLGKVRVKDNKASLKVANLDAGNHALKATFNPDDSSTYADSSSSEVLIDIAKATPKASATLTQNPNEIGFGDTLNFNLEVSPSLSGVAQFKDSQGNNIGDVVNVTSGSATLNVTNLAVGRYQVTATFTPDDTTNYNGSTSNQLDFVVAANKVNLELTTDPPVSKIAQGDPVDLVANITPDNAVGSLQFYDRGEPIGEEIPVNQENESYNNNLASLVTPYAADIAKVVKLRLNNLSVGEHDFTASFTSSDGLVFSSASSNDKELMVDPKESPIGPTNPVTPEKPVLPGTGISLDIAWLGFGLLAAGILLLGATSIARFRRAPRKQTAGS